MGRGGAPQLLPGGQKIKKSNLIKLLRTPAASHRPLPTLGYFRWVNFKLFVHFSFIIRSLFVIIRSLCKRSHPRAMFRFLGAILGSLGSILGGLEAILGGLGRVLGGLGGTLGAPWGGLGGSWAVLADLGTILG